MIVRLLRWLLAGVALLLVAAAIGLVLAHREIRSIDPALPDFGAIDALAASEDLPVRVSMWNTASQSTPRSSVLEPSLDPDPEAPYVMSHPAFAIEWSDGRTLLVDAGMEPDDAVAFGRLIELMGGGAAEPHGGLAARIAAWLGKRPLAIAFTHLHTDHVGGVVEMCRVAPADTRVRLLQTGAQVDLANFTTRPARALLDTASCLTRERLADAPIAPLPGLPGAFVIRAAGHTPDSQIVGAWVRSPEGVRGYLFAGDAANAVDGIRRDVPKPRAYQTLMVPEWEDRLRRVRAFLRDAEARGFVVAIAHDERHLATTGIPTLAP